MKTARIAWDKPQAYDPDYYIVRYASTALETHATERIIDVPDGFAGKIEVVAVENDTESEPCAVWVEEFSLFIRWEYIGRDDAPGCVIVSLPTLVSRRYCVERSIDQGRTWAEFADFAGTGRNEELGGGTEKQAHFRAWSRPIE